MQLQQGFATGEMGFRGHVAQQQCCASDVCSGSKADIAKVLANVRFTSES
jgi:hypothetical protein